MLSFLHCGDLHLGFNQFGLAERFDDFGRSFQTIADQAIAKKVQYLLIAGDFFNKRMINSTTLSQAITVLTGLKQAQIQVIAIEGNHDKAPYGEGDSWLGFLHEQGLIHLLQPEFAGGKLMLTENCLLEYSDIRFIGLGYLGSMTARRLQELKDLLEPSSKFTVLLLHGAVGQLFHLGGVERTDLAGLEELIDYVALGHIHSRYELEEWIYNPGAPENWDLGEGGKEKGCYYVEVKGKEKQVQFLPSSPRPVYNLTVDLSTLTNPEEVAQFCRLQLEQVWNAEITLPLIQLKLQGEVPFNPLTISPGKIGEELQANFSFLHIEILNQTVQQGQGAIEYGGVFNRQKIEEAVLQELLKAHFPGELGENQDFIQGAAELTQELRDLSVAGDHAAMLAAIKVWTAEWLEREAGHEDLSTQAN